MRDSTLAVYAMYRGLLNFLASVSHGQEDTCKYLTLCEAAHVAGTRGQFGRVIALAGGRDRKGSPMIKLKIDHYQP